MMTSLAPKDYTSDTSKATHHHYMRVVGTHVSLLGMAGGAKETNEKAGGGGVDQLFQYTGTCLYLLFLNNLLLLNIVYYILTFY